MDKFLDQFKQLIFKWSLEKIFLGFFYLLSFVFGFFEIPKLDQFLNQIDRKHFFGVILFLLILVIYLFRKLKRIEKKPIRPTLIFDKKIGIYFTPDRSIAYCPSCYAKNIDSPLQEQPEGWNCLVKDCRQRYSDVPQQKIDQPKIFRNGFENFL